MIRQFKAAFSITFGEKMKSTQSMQMQLHLSSLTILYQLSLLQKLSIAFQSTVEFSSWFEVRE
jgi:hypothetical protein